MKRQRSLKYSLLHGKLVSLPFLLLPLIVLISINIYPLILSIRLSFSSWNLLGGQPSFVGLANFIDLLQTTEFWSSLQFTLIYVGVVVGLELILGIIIAMLLNQVSEKYSSFFTSILLLPFLLIPVVNGMLWKLIFDPSYGIMKELLNLKGFVGFANIKFARAAVMFADIWSQTPIVTIILLAGLRSLPQEPYEAGVVDGASNFQLFRYLTFPLLTPFILVAVLIRFIFAINTFDHIYIMTKGGPGIMTETSTLAIYRIAWQTRFDLGYAASYSFLVFIIVMVVATMLVKILQKRGVF